MEMIPSSLTFTVERSQPELIVPAKPTPNESKFLSDLDVQFASHVSNINFFRSSPGAQAKDPAKVIKDAIAEALVHYYPLAGRIVEGGSKLIVDCNSQGILFTEAIANVKLEQFGLLVPPFPCVDDLICDVPGSCGVLHCPLLLIQVTRLLCGGFILGYRLNHAAMDASGLIQFFTAVSEIARGAGVPSVQPVWERNLLDVQRPISIEKESGNDDAFPNAQFCQRCFFFGPEEITRLATNDSHGCTRSDIITACLWRCHTNAINLGSDEEVYLSFAVNIRESLNPPLPTGFYGNASMSAIAVTSVARLCQGPIVNTLELLKTAKANMTDELIRSRLLDAVGINSFEKIARTYFVSNVSRLGFSDFDFGWGKAAYGGPVGVTFPGSSFLHSGNNEKGEKGIVVMTKYPEPVMKRFAAELAMMTNKVLCTIKSSL